MGAVLARFRKEKTTAAVLEGLEDKIQQLEKYTLNTQEQKKRFVGNFLAIAIGVYVVAFLVFYFVYFPPTWKERIIYSVPLFLFPFVIILLRKLFTWYFQRKLNKNSTKVTALRTEKKKILEQVMDKETYKVAVNLLARFGDKSNGARYSFGTTPRVPSTALTPMRARVTTSTTSNQLTVAPNARASNTSLMATPRPASQAGAAGAGQLASLPRQLSLSPSSGVGQELRRRTPFPIVNQQDKGVFERIVDVLIGDGPQDRFAMICKECFGHNGMALKEEFDYATFRCAFCSAMNHSRKARPVAPRLPVQQASLTHIAAKDSSDSSSSDDDSDRENLERRHVPINETTESISSAATTAAAEKIGDFEDSEAVKLHAEDVADALEEQQQVEPHEEVGDASNLKDEFKKEM